MSINSKVFCLAICICMTALTFTGTIPVKAIESGNDYYVSTDGSDTNSGSIEQPWASLAFAANTLQPGDTLNIRGGTYLSNQLTITKSGTVQLPITIKAYSDGILPPELPIIDMGNEGGNPGGAGIFFVSGTSNIILDGLSVLSTRGTIRAIDLMPYPFPSNYNVHNNVIVRNCTTKDTNCAVGIGSSSGISVENCFFYDNGGNLVYIAGVQDGQGSGDAVSILNSEKIVVKDCYFGNAGHYSLTTGMWTRETIGTPLPCKDIVFNNNLIENHWGGGMGFGVGTFESVAEDNIVKYIGEALINYPKYGFWLGADNNILRRNIFMKAASVMYDPGIAMISYGTDALCVNNRIYNNIFYKNGREGIRITQRDKVDVKDNKVLNNIMYSNRVAGSEKMNWLPGELKNEDMWYNISVDAMTTAGSAAWSTGNANNNQFYNNNFLPYAENKDFPGYSRFMWISLRTTDKFYSLRGLNTKFPTAFFKNIEENPMFVNEGLEDDSLCDFNLKADSPCIDSGAHLTKTVEVGTSITQLKVEDSRFFTDGCGMMPGDKIKIGDREPMSAIEIDYTNNVITLASPVTYAAGENVDLPYNGTAPDMGVYESPYSITRTEEPMSTAISTPTATMTSTPTATASATPVVTPKTFPDVNPDNFGWAQESVEYLAGLNIINGSVVDGQLMYLPANTITRAELCKLIVVAYGFTQDGQATAFTDIDRHWAANYIAIASSQGIVKGYEDNTFKPDAGISREELAVMISRAMLKKNIGSVIPNEQVNEKLSVFLDQASIDDWARNDVAYAVENGIIKGSPVDGGGFNLLPLDTANRAETAVMIKRAYDQLT